jgi:hypothetical protein
MSWSVSEVSKWYTLWVEFNLCKIILSRNFFTTQNLYLIYSDIFYVCFFLTMPFRLFCTGHTFTFVCFTLIMLFLSFVLRWLYLFLSSILSWLFSSVIYFTLTISFSFLYLILILRFRHLFYTDYIFFFPLFYPGHTLLSSILHWLYLLFVYFILKVPFFRLF